MGVDFYCGKYTVHFTYSGWDRTRCKIIAATFDYIMDKFEKDQLKYGELPEEDDNYIGENSSYYYHTSDIKSIIETLEKSRASKPPVSDTTNIFSFIKDCNNDVPEFVNTCNRGHNYQDSLIYFDIGGLYSLCSKNDCEGFYSHGNSSDICQLFDLIEPFVEKDEEFYKIIYGGRETSDLYGLFKESIDTKTMISIC
jgi:hypothetical protein